MKFFLIDAHMIWGSVYHMMKDNSGVSPAIFFDRCFKVIENSLKKVDPTHALFCMDDYSRSERKIAFPMYRSDSFRLPSEYYAHLPAFLKKLKESGVASISVSSYESYDIISTLVSKARAVISDSSFIVLGTDKRLYSLFGSDFSLYNPFSKGDQSTYDYEWFKSKTSVNPSSWADLLALVGYSQRGIDGIPGVGMKTAESLIAQYGSVFKMIENKDSIEGATGERFRELIHNNQYASCYLTTLKSNLSLGITINDMSYS